MGRHNKLTKIFTFHMITMINTTIIKKHLQETLQPTFLEVIDDSHLHIGHPGAAEGGKHFTVRIATALFADKSLLACHRLVYNVLTDWMGREIHALKIEVVKE